MQKNSSRLSVGSHHGDLILGHLRKPRKLVGRTDRTLLHAPDLPVCVTDTRLQASCVSRCASSPSAGTPHSTWSCLGWCTSLGSRGTAHWLALFKSVWEAEVIETQNRPENPLGRLHPGGLHSLSCSQSWIGLLFLWASDKRLACF